MSMIDFNMKIKRSYSGLKIYHNCLVCFFCLVCILRFRKLVDKNSTTFVTFHCLHRWLAVRLDFVVTIFVTITAIFVVTQPSDATRAGLALSYAFQVSIMPLFPIQILIIV